MGSFITELNLCSFPFKGSLQNIYCKSTWKLQSTKTICLHLTLPPTEKSHTTLKMTKKLPKMSFCPLFPAKVWLSLSSAADNLSSTRRVRSCANTRKAL